MPRAVNSATTDCMSRTQQLPPAILLGGQENSLAVARNLGRHGVAVHLAAPESCWALRSRHVAGRHPIPADEDRFAFWDTLLSRPGLGGAVIFACSDEAIEFMASRRDELGEKYVVDEHLSWQQLAMLDKCRTLELAADSGVPVPWFRRVAAIDDCHALRGELRYPLIVKPILSHRFQQAFGTKMFVVDDFDALAKGVNRAFAAGVEVMLCDFVPGPDSRLCSCYTYIDRSGTRLFEFTKRMIRRSPINIGLGCYHVTDPAPEAAELGRRFFDGMGFRGLGCIEFKRDVRDDQLKVIEVNARFTAAQELLTRAGMPIDWIIYCHLAGLPLPAIGRLQPGRHFWYPTADFDAYRDLSARDEISFPAWLRSVARPQVFPYFQLRDPWPALARGWRTFRSRILRRS